MGVTKNPRGYPREKSNFYTVKPKGIPFDKQKERTTMGVAKLPRGYPREMSKPYTGKSRGIPLNEQINVLGIPNTLVNTRKKIWGKYLSIR